MSPWKIIFMHLSVSAILCLLFGACTAPIAPVKPPPPTPVPAPSKPLTSRESFQIKCAKCHDLVITYAALDKKEHWTNTVAAMAAKDLSWINASQMKTIVAYFEEHAAVVADLFNRRCASCHQWGKLRQLERSTTQWKTMIKYMGTRSGQALTKDETEILFQGLTAR